MKDKLLNTIIVILVVAILIIAAYFVFFRDSEDNITDYERQNEEQELSEDV